MKKEKAQCVVCGSKRQRNLIKVGLRKKLRTIVSFPSLFSTLKINGYVCVRCYLGVEKPDHDTQYFKGTYRYFHTSQKFDVAKWKRDNDISQ